MGIEDVFSVLLFSERMTDSSTGGFEIKDISGHGGAVQHICVWNSGSILASTSDDDHTVRLWDLRSAETRAVRCVRFRGDEECFLSCTCFGAGEEELFIGCGADVIKYDMRANSDIVMDGMKLPRIFSAEDEINEVSYNAGTSSMDGGKPLLAVADDTGAVTVIRVSDGSVYRKLDKQHTNVCFNMCYLFHLCSCFASSQICSSVKWNPSAKTCLVSGALDSTIVSCDVHTKKCLGRDKFAAGPGGANPPLAHCVDVSRDGSTVATAVGDGNIVISSWKQLKRIGLLMDGHSAAASAVCFMRSGQQIVSGGVDETVILWNIKGKGTGATKQLQRWEKQGKINWVAAHPTQNAFFVASSNRTIRMITLR